MWASTVIPDFDERGYLPPGVHRATLEEIVERFGCGSEIREAQAASLHWLFPLCKSAGIERWVINGSFATGAAEPNDVDCVLLRGAAYSRGSAAARSLRKGLPFLDVKVVGRKNFDFMIDVIFATDRRMVRKGMVEVILDD